jgi:hypothetical protein
LKIIKNFPISGCAATSNVWRTDVKTYNEVSMRLDFNNSNNNNNGEEEGDRLGRGKNNNNNNKMKMKKQNRKDITMNGSQRYESGSFAL